MWSDIVLIVAGVILWPVLCGLYDRLKGGK
jgi:hypothetical protein